MGFSTIFVYRRKKKSGRNRRKNLKKIMRHLESSGGSKIETKLRSEVRKYPTINKRKRITMKLTLKKT